jgi:hypothetical protein
VVDEENYVYIYFSNATTAAIATVAAPSGAAAVTICLLFFEACNSIFPLADLSHSGYVSGVQKEREIERESEKA